MTLVDEPPYDPAYDEPDPTRRGHLTAVPTTGRPAPYSDDLERAILGAALLSIAARDHLPPADDFYVPTHQLIAGAIAELHSDGATGDILVDVAETLRNNGTLDHIGGPVTLLEIQAAAPSTSNAPRWAQAIRDHATRRRIAAAGHEIATLAADTTLDPTTLAATAQGLLDQIHDQTTSTTLRPIADSLPDYLAEIDARSNRDLAGIATGWHHLDRTIAGLQDGRLYVIAGRPGMGKSDVAAVLALNTARAGHRTLVVSVEMATTELLDRWASSASRLSVESITSGRIAEREADRFAGAITELAEIPLWVDDNPSATAASIRGAARKTKADLVIVDYLQLLGGPKAESRQVEVARLAGDLKRIARDLQVPVVALAQLNRSAEMRVDKHPALADLRESGAIEQDADVIIGLYRDEYYHPNSDQRGVLELGLLKNRSGPQKTVNVGYLPAIKTIANLAGEN